MTPTADHDTTAHRWHGLAVSDVLIRLDAAMDQGLSQNEAVRRLAQHGPNTLPEAKHRSMWRVFEGQFASPLIYILFVAAVIALVMGHRGDAGAIPVVVFVNALIGTGQEGRAERSMESLRKLSALKVRVRRSGAEEIVDAHDLVPGDIVLLAAGDAVAADARLLESAALEAAEAALTGESMPVGKHPEPLPDDSPLADRRNMIHSGTHIAAGRGVALVVATGLQTEVGKIATLASAAVEPRRRTEPLIYVLIAAATITAVLGEYGIPGRGAGQSG